jgi:hypothetical protein
MTSIAASGSFGVTAGNGCGWTATSQSSWITLTSGASGSGNGTVAFQLAPNRTASPRSGAISVAGHEFTITQDRTGCDINGDGAVNVLDLQGLANLVLGIIACPANCDINNDGRPDVLDLQLLVNVILGYVIYP